MSSIAMFCLDSSMDAMTKLKLQSVMPPANGVSPQMVLLSESVRVHLHKESTNKILPGPSMNTQVRKKSA